MTGRSMRFPGFAGMPAPPSCGVCYFWALLLQFVATLAPANRITGPMGRMPQALIRVEDFVQGAEISVDWLLMAARSPPLSNAPAGCREDSRTRQPGPRHVTFAYGRRPRGASMTEKNRWVAGALCCLLAGCAKPPYEGLNSGSYGPLTNYRTTPQVCQQGNQNSVDLEREVIGKLFVPVGGMTKIDPQILNEELQDKFRTPGDFAMPTVVLVENTPERIVFWYVADLVSLDEVNNAAAAHCARTHARPLYEGSAKRCSAPHAVPVLIRGGPSTVTDTYVISAYQCIGQSPARSSRRLSPTTE
jgi:hypothetical protein